MKTQRDREHAVEDELVRERPADHQQWFAPLRQREERLQDVGARAAVLARCRGREEVRHQDERRDDHVRRINSRGTPREKAPRRSVLAEPRRGGDEHHRAADREEQIDAVRAQHVERRRPRPAREIGRLHRVGVNDDHHQRGDRAERLDVPEHAPRFDATHGAPASSNS